MSLSKNNLAQFFYQVTNNSKNKFKKSTKARQNFTDEKIRVKAYQIWEKNRENSPEENWSLAIKSLERENKFRFLIIFWKWTGLGEKKGWDIVTSLSIPLIIFTGGILFNYFNNQQEQEAVRQKLKDDNLKTYFNDMKGFLLDKEHPLKKSKINDESRTISRAITLTTLTQLNSDKDKNIKGGKFNERKKLILQFLYESSLITADPIISLTTANFDFADLRGANFQRANLRGVSLRGANLRRANLEGADLEGANLGGADLGDTNLRDVNLRNASIATDDLAYPSDEAGYIYNANLKDADLRGANLRGADLQGADLRGADFTNISWDDKTNWIDVQNPDMAKNLPRRLENSPKSPKRE